MTGVKTEAACLNGFSAVFSSVSICTNIYEIYINAYFDRDQWQLFIGKASAFAY